MSKVVVDTFYRFLLALALSLSGSAQAEGVQIPPDRNAYTLGAELRTNRGDVQLDSAALALAAYRHGEFVPFEHSANQGFGRDPVWLAFDLAPASEQTADYWLIQAGPAHLDRVTAWLAMPDGSLRVLGTAGDQVDPAIIPRPYLKPTFGFNQPVRPGHTLLLRVENQGTHAAYLRLFRASAFPDVATRHGLLLGVLLTIGILLLGTALGLFLLLRQRIHLIWFGYVALLSMVLMLNNGVVYHYLTFVPLAWLNPLSALCGLLAFSMGIWFLAELFGLHRRAEWRTAWHLMLAWALAVGVLGVVSWMLPGLPLVPLALGMMLPALALGCGLLVWRMLRRDPLALSLGAPLLVFFLVSIGYLLSLLGAPLPLPLPLSSLHWIWHVVAFLTLLMLQAALYFQALAMQRSTQQERSLLMQLLTDKNQELEDKVKARTRELELALRDVQQAEAEQRQLLSMASHEFRTPAAMIKMSLDSLRFLTNSIPPEVNARLDNIRLASQRLTLLTNSLIVDNRLREPRLQIHPATVSIDQMIRDVVAGYPSSTPIQLELPDTPVVIQADATLLSIALHNLIDNALNHGASTRPRVTVGLEALASHVNLAVSDNGPGIPDEEKVRVFERFQRRNTSRGSGLGLSIVSAIVRAHQGSIQARDNRPQGTRMLVQLPRRADATDTGPIDDARNDA